MVPLVHWEGTPWPATADCTIRRSRSWDRCQTTTTPMRRRGDLGRCTTSTHVDGPSRKAWMWLCCGHWRQPRSTETGGGAMRINQVLAGKGSSEVVTVRPDASVRELIGMLAGTTSERWWSAVTAPGWTESSPSVTWCGDCTR